MANAIAPGAHIVLIEYGGPNEDINYLYAAIAEADQLANPQNSAKLHLPSPVSVVSISYGRKEDDQEATFDAPFFTTPGVTYLADTGDEGAPGDYSAFSPDVVAVGGTSLYLNSDGSYQSETGWGASGGGESEDESQLPYQKGISITTGNTPASTYMPTNRATPDVSLVADPRTGVQYYNSFVPPNTNAPPPISFWGTTGGTSLSVPCWAGLIAIVNQGRVESGKQPLTGNTQTLPALYQLPSSDFNDITTGNNAQYTDPNIYSTTNLQIPLTAASGYDMVTGLGSPVANRLVPDLVDYVPDQWTGQGSNNLWSNPGNWSGKSVPTAGADLTFPAGALQETSVDDLGFAFNSITTADDYDFSGQGLTTDDLTVEQGSLKLDCQATVSDAASIAAGAGLTVGTGNLMVASGATFSD